MRCPCRRGRMELAKKTTSRNTMLSAKYLNRRLPFLRMKQELSSLELHRIVAELQTLVGGRIDKIYQPEKGELLFQIYKQGHGKRVLRVMPGRFIYLASG